MDPARLILVFSFFILDVGVLVNGGEIGTLRLESDLSFSSGVLLVIGVDVDMNPSVVFRLEKLEDVNSFLGFVVVEELSSSGVLDKFEAVLSAFIQLFLMPCVTADSTYCRSSSVETMKP